MKRRKGRREELGIKREMKGFLGVVPVRYAEALELRAMVRVHACICVHVCGLGTPAAVNMGVRTKDYIPSLLSLIHT